jgi:hypothetical protein
MSNSGPLVRAKIIQLGDVATEREGMERFGTSWVKSKPISEENSQTIIEREKINRKEEKKKKKDEE